MRQRVIAHPERFRRQEKKEDRPAGRTEGGWMVLGVEVDGVTRLTSKDPRLAGGEEELVTL